MSSLNTNYGIRVPDTGEIIATFGSLGRAADLTGGCLHTILFYINNPDAIHGAQPVAPQSGDFAVKFVETANAEKAAAAYDGMERPTITAVAASVGVCRQVARRLLVTARKLPA